MKRFLIRGISWLTWNLGLDHLIHMINRRRGGVILAYHHISADALERQLELLSRWYTFVSLAEFVRRHGRRESTTGLLVITFDDGFAQEVEAGAALAIRKGWPMTFYLPTRYVLSGRPYWFIRLASMMQMAPRGSYRIEDLSFQIRDDISREQARRHIVAQVFGRPERDIENLIDELGKTLFGIEQIGSEVKTPEPISIERVRRLAGEEMVAFEAHSVTHPYLFILSPEEIRWEMETSRREVEEMTNKPVEHFCYPYGTQRSIGPQASRIARSLFQSATTAIGARCRPGLDLALLPRITMHEHYTPGMTSLKVKATR